MENYTTENLIQYLYNETSAKETKAIEKALQTDWNLSKQFEELKDSQQALNKLVVSPRPQSVAAILNYAQTSTEIAQH